MWSKYEPYYIYDKPVPYKDLLIYPVLMEDYLDFNFYAQCLQVDKNSIPDVEVISMSYLEFLYYGNTEKTPFIFLLSKVFEIVLGKENLDIKFGYDNNHKAIFQINDQIYDSKDFDEIRQIVCEQDCLELPDENIQKEVRDELKKAQEYKDKNSNSKLCSFEDQLICVMISTPMKLEDIYKLPIRKFVKILKRVDHKLHYQIYLQASMSGMVDFKDKSFIRHWMADLENNSDKYKDLLIGVDEMKDKLDFNDLKKQNS